jgi:hypothetical protein
LTVVPPPVEEEVDPVELMSPPDVELTTPFDELVVVVEILPVLLPPPLELPPKKPPKNPPPPKPLDPPSTTGKPPPWLLNPGSPA